MFLLYSSLESLVKLNYCFKYGNNTEGKNSTLSSYCTFRILQFSMVTARSRGRVMSTMMFDFSLDGMRSLVSLTISLYDLSVLLPAMHVCCCLRLYFSLMSRDEELSMSTKTLMVSPAKIIRIRDNVYQQLKKTPKKLIIAGFPFKLEM